MDRLFVVRIDPTKVETIADLLQQRLVSKGMRSGAPRYKPLQNIILTIQRLGARCAIVQQEVQDPDFFAEHSTYYSKWTFPVRRHCDRIHFFAQDPCSDDALAVIDQMAATPPSYLGFVTLRPISMSPAGATIMRAACELKSYFVLAADTFPVNIAGAKFNVTGTPFMQQDNAVGACAQASIWMALRTLRRKEGQAAFSPAQITSAATRFLVRGRTLPNRSGLVVEQITEALRSAGYAPHTIPLRDLAATADKNSLQNARKALYPYVESGMPVLVLLFPKDSVGHAVLLIGHGWTESPPDLILHGNISDPNWTEPLKIYDASSWTEPFIMHNDNSGPYLPLPETASAGDYSLGDAVIALPFLPPDVFVDASEAQLTSFKLLGEVLEDLRPILGTKPGSEKSTMPDVVARTYLQDRADLRSAMVGSSVPDDVKRYYRMKWLPRRVWVTELNALSTYSECPNGKATRLGEIILDSASEPEDGHFLAIHLRKELLPPEAKGMGGVIIDRDALNGEIKAFPASAGVYSPLVRR